GVISLFRDVVPVVVTALGVTLYVVLGAYVTYSGAKLWGSNLLLSHYWYLSSPNSLRALEFYASELSAQRDYERVSQLLEEGVRRHPDSVALLLDQAIINCDSGNYVFDADLI